MNDIESLEAMETPKPFASYSKVVEALIPLAAIEGEDDGWDTAVTYAKFYYEATKSVEENIEYISKIIQKTK